MEQDESGGSSGGVVPETPPHMHFQFGRAAHYAPAAAGFPVVDAAAIAAASAAGRAAVARAIVAAPPVGFAAAATFAAAGTLGGGGGRPAPVMSAQIGPLHLTAEHTTRVLKISFDTLQPYDAMGASPFTAAASAARAVVQLIIPAGDTIPDGDLRVQLGAAAAQHVAAVSCTTSSGAKIKITGGTAARAASTHLSIDSGGVATKIKVEGVRQVRDGGVAATPTAQLAAALLAIVKTYYDTCLAANLSGARGSGGGDASWSGVPEG